MSFTMAGLAQKNEIKAAEKALKEGDATAAKSSLEAAAGSISSADVKIQAQYHFVRGKIYADLAKKVMIVPLKKRFHHLTKRMKLKHKVEKPSTVRILSNTWLLLRLIW